MPTSMSSYYTVSESEDDIGSDDEHFLKIDINNTAAHQTIHTANRTTTSNFRGRLSWEQKNLDIVASTLCTDGFGSTVRIVTRSKKEAPDEKNSTIHERWLHLQTENIRFEDFERLVINVTLQHHEELVPVVMYLLQKVQDSYEEESAYGSYIEPGTALRCDGMDQGNREKPDLSAIFVSMPYLDIGKWRPPNAPKDGSLHLPRGLFQSSYPQEIAIDRDGEQTFRTFKGVGQEEYLRVPQLWALILDSKIIITCGTSNISTTFDGSVEFIDEESFLSQGPGLVKVTDVQKRVKYIPIERCGTFLDLRKSVQKECLAEHSIDLNDCILHLEDKIDELKANEWPGVLKAQRSVFVCVRISPRKTQAIESLDESHLVDYGTLSSDDDNDVGNNMALVVRQKPHSKDLHNSKTGSVLSRKTEASIKRLDLQGYVVNKPTSLEPSSSNELEQKAKIFQLPSGVDLENAEFAITRQSLPSLPEGSEDDEQEHKREGSEANHSDTSAGMGDSDSRKSLPDNFTTDNQAEVINSISDNTADSAVTNDTPSELPRVTRVETFQPTVESDGEEPEEESEHLSLSDPSGAPNDIDESMANEKPPSVQSNDENSRSRYEKDAKRLVDQEAKELRQIIREELAAALGKQKDHEVRFEVGMRKRLARFGFQEDQILALLNPEEKTTLPPGMFPNNPLLPSYQPTYSKIHKKYLDVETLQYYGIPYEFDSMDPNYIIVLLEMEQKDTEVLFEHTRRLRASQDSKLPTQSTDKQEYRDISQRSRSRHRPVKNHSKSSTVPAGDSLGPSPKKTMPEATVWPSHRAATAEESNSGPPLPTVEDVKVNLKIPPFLAWPTTLRRNSDETTVVAENMGVTFHQTEEDLNQTEEDLIELTLTAITRHIIKTKIEITEIPISTDHPFMETYRSGVAFSNVPELTFIELNSKIGPETTGTSSPRLEPNTALLEIENELAFFQKLLRRDTASNEESKIPGVTSSEGKGKDKVTPRLPRRRAIQWQLSALLSEHDSFSSISKRLIDQFVPNYYPHALLRKCWGSLYAISEAMMDLYAENEAHRQQEASNDSSQIYVIKSIPFPDYVNKNQLEELSIAINTCSACSRGTQYADIDDAYQHLHQVHNDRSGVVTAPQRRKLGHWLVSTAGMEMERKNAEMLKLIQALHRRASRLLIKSIEIRNSVANEDNEKDKRFLLPAALVKAAMRTFQFIYTGLFTVQFLRNQRKGVFTSSSSIEFQDNVTLADHHGILADRQLSKAQSELLLMAHTGSPDGSKIVNYRPSPPETTLLISLFSLATRRIHQNRNIEDLYRNHLSTLRYNAMKNPSKRIFRSLFLLEEELSLISTLHKTQLQTLEHFTHLIAPQTARITSRVRMQSFTDIERPILGSYNKLHSERHLSISSLTSQLNKTAQVLRYNLEIAEEGHSKAILVFTLVTIIFLPLSFIAGLFGMNTTDIRDIESDQRIFWAVALPTTSVIGGMSLLIAYGDVGERLERLGKYLKGGERKIGRVAEGYERLRREKGGRDVENGDEEAGKELKGTNMLRRRGRERAAFLHIK